MWWQKPSELSIIQLNAKLKSRYEDNQRKAKPGVPEEQVGPCCTAEV